MRRGHRAHGGPQEGRARSPRVPGLARAFREGGRQDRLCERLDARPHAHAHRRHRNASRQARLLPETALPRPQREQAALRGGEEVRRGDGDRCAGDGRHGRPRGGAVDEGGRDRRHRAHLHVPQHQGLLPPAAPRGADGRGPRARDPRLGEVARHRAAPRLQEGHLPSRPLAVVARLRLQLDGRQRPPPDERRVAGHGARPRRGAGQRDRRVRPRVDEVRCGAQAPDLARGQPRDVEVPRGSSPA